MFVSIVERRLNAIVYRAKFVPTVFAARQIVTHGHVLVNGRKVNIPSFRCKPGDIVELRQKSRELPMVIEAIKSGERDTPEYPLSNKNSVRKEPSWPVIPVMNAFFMRREDRMNFLTWRNENPALS